MKKEELLELLTSLQNGVLDLRYAYNKLWGLVDVTHCDFKTIKVGEYIKCTKLYPQSKKYTVGKMYQIIKERDDEWYGKEIALRDDHNKLTWITRNSGISYTEFALVC